MFQFRSSRRIVRAAGAVGVAGIVALAGGTAVASAQDGQISADPFADLPSQLQLTGTVRDFRHHGEGGHPDFQRYLTGLRVGWVAFELDEDGKPSMRDGGQGFKPGGSFQDAQGRKMFPMASEVEYMDSREGDKTGSLSAQSKSVVTNGETFGQWFRTIPGVNLAKPVSITLEREPGTDQYVFHAHDDRSTGEIEGFFPVNEELYGNPDGKPHNYHFTYELATKFVYDEDAENVFTFFGDDDVWVFIDGKMVIDLGGVHGAISQTVDLSRLNFLEDGEEYELKVFFAERHYSRSNFRIETTLKLRSVELPSTNGAFD